MRITVTEKAMEPLNEQAHSKPLHSSQLFANRNRSDPIGAYPTAGGVETNRSK